MRDEPLTPQIIPSSLVHHVDVLTSPRGGRTKLCSLVLKNEDRTKWVPLFGHRSRIILDVKTSKRAWHGSSACRHRKWIGLLRRHGWVEINRGAVKITAPKFGTEESLPRPIKWAPMWGIGVRTTLKGARCSVKGIEWWWYSHGQANTTNPLLCEQFVEISIWLQIQIQNTEIRQKTLIQNFSCHFLGSAKFLTLFNGIYRYLIKGSGLPRGASLPLPNNGDVPSAPLLPKPPLSLSSRSNIHW